MSRRASHPMPRTSPAPSPATPHPPGPGARGRGFTLVEVVIAVSLSGVLAAVVVSILITSLNVVDRTSEIAHDATDAGLVAAFLYRDAEAAGGTDPDTLADIPGLGVSTSDWGDCPQSGDLVLRLAWIDRLDTAREHPMTVTWALSDGVLNRRACQDDVVVDAALGEHVAEATASCLPGPACDADTEVVQLEITGSAHPEPEQFTLSAALRPAAPISLEPSGVATPLVVVGGAGECPEVGLGAGSVHVLGNAVVDASCGDATIDGDPEQLLATGQVSLTTGTRDLYDGRIPAAPSCEPAVDPALGASPSPSSTVVYTRPVTVTGATTLQPGRYVFCQGLDVVDGAELSGADVFLQVVAGDVTVAPTAVLELSAATAGATANLLLTSAGGDVTIASGALPSVLRGVVHAPAGRVTIDSTTSVAIGTLLADRVAMVGPGPVRLGLPIPTIEVEPVELAPAQVGTDYPTVEMIATEGTAPYSWRATGLPDALSMTSGGLLSGSPTVAGTYPVTITATDATGLAAVFERSLTVKPRLTIPAPGLPFGEVGLAYGAAVGAAGGTPPYAFAATGLPAGLHLAADGTLSGTPTRAGTFTMTVTATDAIFATATATVDITIRPALEVASPASLPGGVTGTAYPTTSVTATGGVGPYTFSARGLPAGLTISSAGLIGGTPTAAGNHAVDVAVTDALGARATAAYALTISTPSGGGDPLGPTEGFQVFVEQDASVVTWDVAGAVAVGGDLTGSYHQEVAIAEASSLTVHPGGEPLGLLVGGQVDLAASRGLELTTRRGWFAVGSAPDQSLLVFGDELHLVPARVTDSWTTPRVVSPNGQAALRPGSAIVPGALDFATAFAELRSSSSRLAELGPDTCPSLGSPAVTERWGTYTVTLAKGQVNVWNLTIDDIRAMSWVVGDVAPDRTTPLVINVTDAGDLVLPTRWWDLLAEDDAWVLWNFPNATTLTLRGSFPGSLLAPNAAVSIGNLVTNGHIVAKSLDLRPWRADLGHFDATIPCLGGGGGAPFVSSPGNLPELEVGVDAGSTTFSGDGGTAPYRWDASGLPDGLSLSSDGVLTGTPRVTGTFEVVIVVGDATGAAAKRAYELIVHERPVVAGPDALPAGQVGTTYAGVTMSVTGGLGPYTWSASGLPAGLTMSLAGEIEGTPSAATPDGSTTVTVTVNDAAGVPATRRYALVVAEADVPAGCPLAPTGWRGEYYPNVLLAGDPGLCRDDAAVDFHWAGRSPGGSIPATNFSVRWTRRQPFAAGTYLFVKGSDDGIRVYVDGEVLIDDWHLQSYRAASRSALIDLTEGYHTIVVEYYQGPGTSRVDLTWSPYVTTPCGTADAEGWLGEYFTNTGLAGAPILCRDDATIDFDWGTGSPAPPMVPSDRFSVRWTRVVDFAATGTYRFVAGSDDGVRVWVDGVLVIDDWRDRSYRTSTADHLITAGEHVVVYEFYENGGYARATLVWSLR